MNRTGIAAGLVLLVSLGGCTNDPAEQDTPTEVTRQQICDVLTPEERADLVGKPVDRPAGRATEFPDFSCRWGAEDDKVTAVQIVSAPVSAWVKKLPAVLDRTAELPDLSADDRKELDQARRLISSGEAGDAAGCQVFSILAEIGGFPKDSQTSVSFLSSGGTPLVAAQHCAGERFSSVAYTYSGNRKQAGVDAAAAVLKVAQRLG
jgi:hypothetical protein